MTERAIDLTRHRTRGLSLELLEDAAAIFVMSAQHAYSMLQALGSLEDEEGLVRLVYAQCLDEIGNRSAAVEVLSDAVSWLMERASAIGNPEWRSSFLTRISENAAILERARKWGIDIAIWPRAVPQTLRGTHA